MITLTVTEDDFFLPEDGEVAEKRFLELLRSPGETWIAAYSLTLAPLFDEIKKADAAGVKIHLLLDHSQSVGRAEAPMVRDLAAALKNGDVTITTAGAGSHAPGEIWHWKGMVVNEASGPPSCWEGSVNLSKSGWLQGNSARVFRSAQWAAKFIDQFNRHRQWARDNEPQYQLDAAEHAAPARPARQPAHQPRARAA